MMLLATDFKFNCAKICAFSKKKLRVLVLVPVFGRLSEKITYGTEHFTVLIITELVVFAVIMVARCSEAWITMAL